MNVITVYFLVIASAFFWGANFVLAGPILADLTPLWSAAIRFMLGATLMLIIAGVRRENMLGLMRRNAGSYVLLGVVGIAAFNLLFFYALQSTSANSASLIMATNPLLTTLLAAGFLGERPTARHFIALPVALLGVAIVIAQGDMHALISMHVARGDLLMLAANVSWAMYNVLGRRFMPQGSPVGNTAWVMVVGAVLLLCTALGSGDHVGDLDIRAGMAMLLMVTCGTVLAYLFWNMGIARLGAARTAIFLNLVPVFAMLIGIALGTLPTAAQLAGGMLVLGGVYISINPLRRAVARSNG